MKKNNLITILVIYFISILQIVYAAPDVVAQNYAAANAPGIKSCTAGYDLLSGNVNFQQSIISSRLPYSFSYNAPLRQNLSAAQEFAQPESSTLGWSDNYQSTIFIQNLSGSTTQYNSSRIFYQDYNSKYYTLKTSNPVTNSFDAKLIFVRLPGEKNTKIFKEENGIFGRLYSADAIQVLNTVGFKNISWSNNLGEYSLSWSGTNLVIEKYGVKYTVSNNSHLVAPLSIQSENINIYLDANLQQSETILTWLNSTARATNTAPYRSSTFRSSMSLYRVENIEQGGRKLNFDYDAYMNLIKVTDSFKNALVLERKFHETNVGTTQTVDESRLVTKVLYTNAGQSASQIAEFKYQSYDVTTPSTGIKSKVYALTESNSTIGGKTTYVNSLTELGAMKAFVASKGRTADSSYYYPILKQVKNSLDQIVRQWDVTQNYVLDSYKTYSTAQTTLRSFTPNTSGTVYDNTSIYDDITRSITTSIALGSSTGSNTVQTTLDAISNGKITVSSTGYPCLTSAKTPISSAEFNTERSQIVKITNANGIASNYYYDSKDRLAAIFEALSGAITERLTSYIYGGQDENDTYKFNIPTEIRIYNTALEQISNVKNSIDINGHIIKQTQTSTQADSTTKTTTYAYFSDQTKSNYGLLESVDGPRTGTADKISYTYDIFGNLSSQSQTINGATRTTTYVGYNTFAQPERIVNPNGLVEKFTYNTDGTLSTKTVGVGGSTGTITGQTTTYTYNSLKQLTSEKSPDGEVTSYQYDLAGQKSLVTLPNGNKIAYTYFPIGIVSSKKQSNSGNTIFAENYSVLDSNGRISKQYSGSNANQLYTTYSYDNNGNVIQTGSAQGNTERWTYDALNRVKTHTDGMGNVDIKDYDTIDNIILAKDAVNAGSSPLTYRNGNVLTQEVNSDYGTKTYTYNEADQLTQRIHSTRKCNYNNLDELGRYRAFACDSTNTGSTSAQYQVTDNYTYDQSRFGRLDKVTSSLSGQDVDTAYTYDAYDRITQKNQMSLLANRWLNTGSQSLNVSYSYSTGGKLTSTTLPSGRVVGYSYNIAAGTLTGINLNNSALIRGITYDGANRITGWSWGASGTASYGLAYATNGLLNSVVNKNDSAVNYSLSYGYDADGRITSIARNNGIKDGFTYDASDRLTGEIRFNGSTSIYSIIYSYDENGNRTWLAATGNHAQPAADATYSYTGNKLSAFKKNGTGQILVYVASGELALWPITAAYDNGGRRKVDSVSNALYNMNYNHKNERITHASISNNTPSNVTQYVYDEESHLVGEYSGSTPIVEYVWMGDKPIAAIYGSGTATKIYYIVTDHLNTPRRLVDSSNQAIVWSWDSTAFGLGTPTGSVTFNLRFPGQYYDVGTGQFYNHNRFYNPELGRYMEPDPIGLEGGLNPYAYAGNNPVMNSDSSGLDFEQLSDWSMSNVITSQASLFASLPKDYFYGDFPTVAQANSNLKINGGSGRDLMVNANRLMVEPNGSGQWLTSDRGNQILPVRVIGYRNDSGNWISSAWNTVPNNQDRGYWVYGELTMSSNQRLYSDTYNFDQHAINNAFTSSNGFLNTVKSNTLTIGRNLLTEIGALNAVGLKSFDSRSNTFQAEGYKINFFNQPLCMSCPILPKR